MSTAWDWVMAWLKNFEKYLSYGNVLLQQICLDFYSMIMIFLWINRMQMDKLFLARRVAGGGGLQIKSYCSRFCKLSTTLNFYF